MVNFVSAEHPAPGRINQAERARCIHVQGRRTAKCLCIGHTNAHVVSFLGKYPTTYVTMWTRVAFILRIPREAKLNFY